MSKINQAIEYVSQGWIPIDRQNLDSIRCDLEAGWYEMRPDLLLDDVKKDISLYALCVKTLAELIQESDSLRKRFDNPEATLAKIDTVIFGEVLDRAEKIIYSGHELDDATPLQLRQICATTISASAAETIAPYYEVESQQAFLTALMRQLGTLLVAWNYPHIFERSLETSSNPDALADKFDRLLGFSPNLLALSVARKWGLAPTTRSAMGDRWVQLDNANARKAANLERICQIGEALARAQNPQRYPQALGEWNQLFGELSKKMGQTELSRLEERINENLDLYQHRLSEPAIKLEPVKEKPTATVKNGDLAMLNPYLKFCDSKLRQALQSFHLNQDKCSDLTEKLILFRGELCAQAGFERGAVYIVDPTSNILKPRLSIGTPNLKGLPDVVLNGKSNSNNPIARAFRSQVPIAYRASGANNTALLGFAAALGNFQRLGVLALAYNITQNEADLERQRLNFKALRYALQNALDLC